MHSVDFNCRSPVFHCIWCCAVRCADIRTVEPFHVQKHCLFEFNYGQFLLWICLITQRSPLTIVQFSRYLVFIRKGNETSIKSCGQHPPWMTRCEWPLHVNSHQFSYEKLQVDRCRRTPNKLFHTVDAAEILNLLQLGRSISRDNTLWMVGFLCINGITEKTSGKTHIFIHFPWLKPPKIHKICWKLVSPAVELGDLEPLIQVRIDERRSTKNSTPGLNRTLLQQSVNFPK